MKLVQLFENFTDLQQAYNNVMQSQSNDFRASAAVPWKRMTLFSHSELDPVPTYQQLVKQNAIESPFNDTGYWIKKFKEKQHSGIVEFINMMVDVYDKRKERNDQKNRETKFNVVLKRGPVTVYEPLTYEAARKLGRGTHWCTSGSTSEFFDSYTSDGELYYVFVDVDGSTEKFALQISDSLEVEGEGTTVWDAQNEEIDREEFNDVLSRVGVNSDRFWDVVWGRFR